MIAPIYPLVASRRAAGGTLGRAAIVIGSEAFVIMFALDPRRPPPERHVSWPHFKRQFAEDVEARRPRDTVPAG